jgi:hypothetical protein
MATTSHYGQAAGFGAAQCIKNNILPAKLVEDNEIKQLQQTLNLNGQSIPEIPINQNNNLINSASIKSSSELVLDGLKPNGNLHNSEISIAQLLPLKSNIKYNYTFYFSATQETSITAQLRVSEKIGYYTPETILESKELKLDKGEQEVSFSFDAVLEEDQYAFITFLRNKNVSYRASEERITGLVSVFNCENKAVNNTGKQTPPANSGLDTFEFWIPMRRPKGQNLAFKVTPSIKTFSYENLKNGFVRPYLKPNAWVAKFSDKKPTLLFNWKEEKIINEIKLFLDTDYDHPLESSLMGHPEDVIPFCLRNFKIYSKSRSLLFSVENNYQTIVTLKLESPISTTELNIEMETEQENVPVSIFEIQIQ